MRSCTAPRASASGSGPATMQARYLMWCGAVPTMETLAAVQILRAWFPDLRVRVVNVVDLMRLQDDREHPHGLSDREFDALFTACLLYTSPSPRDRQKSRMPS